MIVVDEVLMCIVVIIDYGKSFCKYNFYINLYFNKAYCMYRNETKRNEAKRNETKRNEMKLNRIMHHIT